jgi:hypothetical protein
MNGGAWPAGRVWLRRGRHLEDMGEEGGGGGGGAGGRHLEIGAEGAWQRGRGGGGANVQGERNCLEARPPPVQAPRQTAASPAGTRCRPGSCPLRPPFPPVCTPFCCVSSVFPCTVILCQPGVSPACFRSMTTGELYRKPVVLRYTVPALFCGQGARGARVGRGEPKRRRRRGGQQALVRLAHAPRGMPPRGMPAPSSHPPFTQRRRGLPAPSTTRACASASGLPHNTLLHPFPSSALPPPLTLRRSSSNKMRWRVTG